MANRDEDAGRLDIGRLTLCSVSRQTIDVLYEFKVPKHKPLCRLVDDIVPEYFEKAPSMLAVHREEVRRSPRYLAAPRPRIEPVRIFEYEQGQGINGEVIRAGLDMDHSPTCTIDAPARA